VLVPQPPILEIVSQKYFCRCLIKGEKEPKKSEHHKVFKCHTVSVSFSACRCRLFVVSSKEERKKRVWRQLCEWLSEAVAYLPAAVSQLLLEALFMQISRVSLTLT
jgi:predicted transcriptional regulator